VGVSVSSISSFLLLAFFDFSILILKQGISILIRVRDLEGMLLSLRVLADNIKAILVRLSLICKRKARGASVKGIRSIKGYRFYSIFKL
jgi:hypothetical protein